VPRCEGIFAGFAGIERGLKKRKLLLDYVLI